MQRYESQFNTKMLELLQSLGDMACTRASGLSTTGYRLALEMLTRTDPSAAWQTFTLAVAPHGQELLRLDTGLLDRPEVVQSLRPVLDIFPIDVPWQKAGTAEREDILRGVGELFRIGQALATVQALMKK
eukprot:tig00000492_g1528.t1